MSFMRGGVLRDDADGALVTVPNASRANPVETRRGWIIDANGAVVTLDAAPNGFAGGRRTILGVLATVPKASAVGPLAFRSGWLEDANGQIVTVTQALATAPVRFQNGFLRDATGALVVTA